MVLAIIEWLAIISLAVAAWAILRQSIWMTRRRAPRRLSDAGWDPRTARDPALVQTADASGADTKPLRV